MAANERALVWGPTFEEMLHPEKMPVAVRKRAVEAAKTDPLDPVNLFNITWKDENCRPYSTVLPKELTGIDAPVAVLYRKAFPTRSHKVGATYSVTLEHQLEGKIAPGRDTLVYPSTGNYGIGGAWVGARMGYDALVILPELMSQERFDRIASYGARYIKTPGCESSVKEIFDKCHELRREPDTVILNQFEVMANYRWHYAVTGNTASEVIRDLGAQGVGNGRCAAFVSSMGSAGTIAAGDRLKQLFPSCRIVGLEPTRCPTLYSNGYGDHDIQGIGDKHVTWIHNVLNMDLLICVDDMECKKGLQLLTDPVGMAWLRETGVSEENLRLMASIFGISGVCNVLGAIKAAKFYGFSKDDVIVTVCTDAIDRYHSVMRQLDERFGGMTREEAKLRHETLFLGQRTDWVQEGTRLNRERWFNLKYYTWVEQQGKTVAELDAQRSPAWWEAHQAKVADMDARLLALRG